MGPDPINPTLRLVVFVLVALGATSPLCAAPRYADQLARECDELIALAVKRPYGWAWAEEAPLVKPKAGAQAVTFDPAGSAGAGLVLAWAGELLDNPRYKEAALHAARGIAAVRQPTGQIPSRPLFYPGNAGGHDAPLLVAHRAAAHAALGLTLDLLTDAGAHDESIRRDALAIFNWLIRQQAAAGAWPQGYPPTTAPQDATRLTRLDTPDFRDSVFAMLLASQALNDPRARLSVERSIQVLLRMRIGAASRLAEPLWSTAYTLDALPTDRVADFPAGVDALASRNAMQILLAAYVMLGDPPARGDDKKVLWSQPLLDAAAAAAKLPRYEGKWVRLYDYDVPATPPPPSTQPTGFEVVGRPAPPARRTDRFGLDTLIVDTRALAKLGREKYAESLAANFTIPQRLAAALCGLEEDPFSLELPARAEDIAAYLKDHEAKFRPLGDAPPTSLDERVRRIYLLVIRAKLERRAMGS